MVNKNKTLHESLDDLMHSLNRALGRALQWAIKPIRYTLGLLIIIGILMWGGHLERERMQNKASHVLTQTGAELAVWAGKNAATGREDWVVTVSEGRRKIVSCVIAGGGYYCE